MRRKILVVDDEPHIVELLVMNLKQNGYDSYVAGDGPGAIERAITDKPDLVLLDLMLPGMSGLEVCRILRQDPLTARIPVIMLTAKSEESDKVIGLRIGADDYVTKPFGLRELLARIEVALRHRDALPPHAPDPGALRAADLRIDEEGHEVRRDDERIPLSPTEFALLALLAKHAGKVIGRTVLIDELGLAEASREARALDVHVRNLRKKLGTRPDRGAYVETVRGVGYRCNV